MEVSAQSMPWFPPNEWRPRVKWLGQEIQKLSYLKHNEK